MDQAQRIRVLELWSIGWPAETAAIMVGVTKSQAIKAIRKSMEMPANFYEFLLVKGGMASRKKTVEAINAKRMSRRRRASMIRRTS